MGMEVMVVASIVLVVFLLYTALAAGNRDFSKEDAEQEEYIHAYNMTKELKSLSHKHHHKKKT